MERRSDPVLLLHGQPGRADDWASVQAEIAGRARSVAFDRPGWDGRGAPRDLAGNAQAAVAVLDQNGIERATVVGHSLGAGIAAWLAAEYAERVGALVLAAPAANCASLNRLDELLAMPILGSALSTSAFVAMAAALRLTPVRRRLTSDLGVRDDYLRQYARTLLNPVSWHAFVVEQRMLLRDLPALEDRLAAIHAPTTIVVGTADRIVTPASAQELAGQIPHAKLVRLPGASHLLTQQRPRELAELILEAGATQDSPGCV